ncbi:hypothetical protein [uncultured Dialister sp.]|jgi:hypothetical protein|uniref:hypothetical protein n=1 Tax=uncultured Dialister sp. TaxID=278064 RepID=UPI00205932AB|nr:hypothetical protein [uncultured Dialister sp.]DAG50345.1 MAG TPA: hypothetical protein [Caudoviricetes sp.]
MTEKTFSMATMKVKLASKQTLSAKLTADARMTAEMDLLLKGDKGDKGGQRRQRRNHLLCVLQPGWHHGD